MEGYTYQRINKEKATMALFSATFLGAIVGIYSFRLSLSMIVLYP